MLIKRYLMILLSLFVAVSLVSCGGDDPISIIDIGEPDNDNDVDNDNDNDEEAIIYAIAFDIDGTDDTITFFVNMTGAEIIVGEDETEDFDPEIHGVYITGSIFDWPEPGDNEDLLLAPFQEDTELETSGTVEEGDHEYKYFWSVNGDSSWDNGEWPGEPNREVTIDGTMEVNDVWGEQPE